MIAPPSTQRKGLAWAPATWALLLPMVLVGLSWPWLPASRALATVLVLAALGALLGCHLKYRSRLGVAAAVGVNLLGGALFIGLGGACVLMVTRMMARPDLSASALSTTALTLLACTSLGLALRGRQYLRAERSGQLPLLLAPSVDLDRGILRAMPQDAPPTARGGLSVVLAAALGTQVPLLVQQEGGSLPWLMMAVTCLMVPAFAYVLYALVGPGLMHFALLRRIERRNGWRFKRDDAAALAQARASFWLARWLCRQEDLIEQAPAEPPPRRARHRTRR